MVHYLNANPLHDVVLESPQALTLDAGDRKWWADGVLNYAQIDDPAQRAIVHLHARVGMIRRRLNLKSRQGSVDHFQLDDAATKLRSMLVFNRDTLEYVFRERGVANGRPYSVKASGWLRVRALGAA